MATTTVRQRICNSSEIDLSVVGGFKSSYQRNNKKFGKKHLRCFPCCGPSHDLYAACEVPLCVRYYNTVDELEQTKYYAFARFHIAAEDNRENPHLLSGAAGKTFERDIKVGEFVNMADLRPLLRTDVNRINPVYIAKNFSPTEQHLDAKAKSYVQFEFKEKGWHYGWRGGRYVNDTKHQLRMYVFSVEKEEKMKCVAIIATPSFTIFSSRSGSPSKRAAEKNAAAQKRGTNSAIGNSKASPTKKLKANRNQPMTTVAGLEQLPRAPHFRAPHAGQHKYVGVPDATTTTTGNNLRATNQNSLMSAAGYTPPMPPWSSSQEQFHNLLLSTQSQEAISGSYAGTAKMYDYWDMNNNFHKDYFNAARQGMLPSSLPPGSQDSSMSANTRNLTFSPLLSPDETKIDNKRSELGPTVDTDVKQPFSPLRRQRKDTHTGSEEDFFGIDEFDKGDQV